MLVKPTFYYGDVNSAYYTGDIKSDIDALVTFIKIKKENKNRWHRVLDLRKGTVNVLTEEYLFRLLEDDKDLLNSFKNEGTIDSTEILIKYIEMLNDKEKE